MIHKNPLAVRHMQQTEKREIWTSTTATRIAGIEITSADLMPSSTKCTHFASRKRVHETTSLTPSLIPDAERQAKIFVSLKPAAHLVSHFFSHISCVVICGDGSATRVQFYS